MRSFCFLVVAIVVSSTHVAAQSVDQWRTYVSHISVQEMVNDKDGGVWVATTGGLFHRSASGQVVQYSKVDGLYATNPTGLAYDDQYHRIWLGFPDGTYSTIDIESGVIRNFTDIQRNTRFPTRRINNLRVVANEVLIATDFGIVIVSTANGVVRDSFTQPGSFGTGVRIWDAIRRNGILLLATEKGLAVGDPSVGDLLVSGSWATFPTAAPILTMGERSDGVYLTYGSINARYDGATLTPTSQWPFTVASYQSLANGRLAAISASQIDILASNGTVQTLTRPGSVFTSIASFGSDLMIGTRNVGVSVFRNATFEDPLELNTPYLNLFSQLHVSDGVLGVATSSTPGQFSIGFTSTGYSLKSGEEWENVNADTDEFFTSRSLNSVFRVSSNATHWFFGTFGHGIVRRDKVTGEHVLYNQANGNLPGFDGGASFIVGSGLSPDTKGNLWATIWANTTEPLVRYDRQTEQWTRFPVSSKVPFQTLYWTVMMDSYDQAWVTLLTPSLLGRGLLVIRYDATGAEQSYRLTSLDAEGALPNDRVKAVVQDQRGEVWVGTDRGVVRYLFPDRIIGGTVQERRATPLINEDPTVSDRILLRDIQVSAMAVDASNQKWIGTEDDGIWLVSSTGGAVLQHFTAENSPLPSNKIVSIAIDSKTGEVYIATDIGMVGYVAESIEGRESMNRLVVYPNPFTYSENDGQAIYIEGLKDDSTVHILSVDGRLVRRFDTRGGRASWDGRDEQGRKLPTGVYTVVGTHESGERGTGKILLVP
jgi:ligand-binding sensor domain-containing protein